MRILVLSDTHIPSQAKQLPKIIKQEAELSDCCLHCGDFVSYSVYQTLADWIPTYGVCGNMDDEEVRRKLPKKQILNFEDITLAFIHGGGNPQNLINYVNKEFISEVDSIDIFVFGHSHTAMNKEREGKIYFNPGSPTDTIFTLRRSFGILEVKGEKIERRIVDLG